MTGWFYDFVVKNTEREFLANSSVSLFYHGSLSGLLPVTRYRPSTKCLPTQDREYVSGHLQWSFEN